MNYDKLTKLAAHLDQQHSRPGEYGFIVAPHSEALIDEHKKAMIHTGRVFNYEPASDERLGVLAVTRSQENDHIGFAHTRLEHIDSYETLATPEMASLMNEYREYARTHLA